ncbi:hypothetical protein HY732_03055 [Candidatus Uhrbacteria bacterium]|nr:hypothetical protein [Candidatus Uhrbacteria bacterium]
MSPSKKNALIFFLAAFMFLGAAFFVSGASPVFAEGPTDLGDITHGNLTQWNYFTRGFGVNDYSAVAQPGTIVQRITAIFFGFLGIIAVVMVMYSGFLWLTAGGEEDKTKKATTLLFQSVIGLVIILASWVLVYYVLAQLTRAVLK